VAVVASAYGGQRRDLMPPDLLAQYLVGGDDANGPQVQRTDVRFDRPSIPDHNHAHSRRLDVSLGRALRILLRDGKHVRHVPLEIVLRQTVDDELFESAREIGRRFELRGKPQGEVVLCPRELVGGDRLPNAIQLDEELTNRVGRLVGLYPSCRDEGTSREPHVETRPSAIGESVFLAEILVQPGGK